MKSTPQLFWHHCGSCYSHLDNQFGLHSQFQPDWSQSATVGLKPKDLKFFFFFKEQQP